MPAILTWLWTIAGWILIAIGLLLLLRGRFFRQRLASPRCPRCGYSAQGLTTRTCPECGFTARSDDQLLTVPARWRWRTVGLVVAMIGWLLLRVPLVIQRGWPGGIPDWALAFVAPKTDGNLRSQSLMFTVNGSGGRASINPPTPDSAAERLENEALSRLLDGTFSHPFADWYLRRCSDVTQDNIAARLQFPVAWPWDVPVDGVVYKPGSGSFPRLTYTADRFTGPSKTMRIHLIGEIERREYALGDFTVPIDATRPLATFFTLKNDQASNDAVKAAFLPVICAGVKHDIWIESSPTPPAARPVPGAPAAPAPPPNPALPDFAGLRVGVVLGDDTLGGNVLGTTNIPLGPQNGWCTRPAGATFLAGVWWKDGARQRALEHFDELELHIRGDVDIAWEAYRMSPWTRPVAWTGTLRIKPANVRRTH